MGFRRGQSSKKEKRAVDWVSFVLCGCWGFRGSCRFLSVASLLPVSLSLPCRRVGFAHLRRGDGGSVGARTSIWFQGGQSMAWLFGGVLAVIPSSVRGRGEGKGVRYTVRIGTGYYSGSITRSIGSGWGVQSVYFLVFVFLLPTLDGRGGISGWASSICCIWRTGNRVVFFDGAGCAIHAKRERGISGMAGQGQAGLAVCRGLSSSSSSSLRAGISVPLVGAFCFFYELISHFTSTVTCHLSLWVGGDLTFCLGTLGVAFVFFFSFFLTCSGRHCDPLRWMDGGTGWRI